MALQAGPGDLCPGAAWESAPNPSRSLRPQEEAEVSGEVCRPVPFQDSIPWAFVRKVQPCGLGCSVAWASSGSGSFRKSLSPRWGPPGVQYAHSVGGGGGQGVPFLETQRRKQK